MTMCTYFGTLKLIIMINLWTSICLQDAQAIRNPFEVVQRCPFNESEWKVRAAHTTCNGSESYHCLLTEGGVSLREQCTDASLFTSGFCPIFTNEGYLQWSACKDTACPTSSYRSDEVYQYQICYQKTDNPIEKNTEKGSNDSSSVTRVSIIIIIVPILLAFVLLLVLVVVFYKRKQCGFKDNVQQRISDLRTRFQHSIDTEVFYDVERDEPSEQSQPLMQRGNHDEIRQKTYKLKELFKYFIHILKQELGVNDLKEKVVIHAKSINEHFTEPLIKDLQSVKNLNDYSYLDTSLVFALLTNFCEGIKPPIRGWDYEPLDDETHVGADIERIRFIWNKYCDDDFEFKHLDDVYNRMKQKYGTVAVHEDDGVRKDSPTDEENEKGLKLMKKKIRSIQLNPDCTVKRGIVITENVTTVLNNLKSRNVVILKGVIGCGKTHALKAIENHFQENSWETAWVWSENVEEEITNDKPTILLCDNLFGRFGNSEFTQYTVDKIERALKEIENFRQTTKIVIGIHTHVYEEVKKTLKLRFLDQKSITVVMDNLSEAETLLIFKEQLKREHCELDSTDTCWFKCIGFQSVLEKLSKNQSDIGSPFLSLMYCNEHKLFSDEAFSVDPVKTLVQHFLKVKHDSPKLYYCLVYLMCVQHHNIEEEPENWAGHISAEVTKDNLRYSAKTSGFLQVESTIATFAHELLTTALFKSAAAEIVVFLSVLEKCETDIFLQLLRPTDSIPSDLYVECTCMYNESDFFKRCLSTCAYKLANKYKNEKVAHPLMKIKFLEDKYFAYLYRKPTTIGFIRF